VILQLSRKPEFVAEAVGTITFAGELGPYLPYLRLGEITHVGSRCVVGLGKYRVIIKEDSDESERSD
jgi:hypothetical protein